MKVQFIGGGPLDGEWRHVSRLIPDMYASEPRDLSMTETLDTPMTSEAFRCAVYRRIEVAVGAPRNVVTTFYVYSHTA